MTFEIENKLSELLELLAKADDKYDIAPEICFEIMCFCTDSHSGAHAILYEARDLYFEHVIDMCEEHSDEKN